MTTTPVQEGAAFPDKGRAGGSHFRTDHLLSDLRGRTVRGGAVTISAQAARFVLQMGSTAVMARLLVPADFGLVAMVTAVTGFVVMFKDAGLSMATVQRAEVTHEQVSTLFWINVVLSALVMIVVASMSPLLAWIYSEPRLVGITLLLSGTFVFGGLTVQHKALLTRQMRFVELAAMDIGGMILGIATGITMAAMGFGYWSLVGVTAGTTIGTCALAWLLCGWWPGLPRRRSGVGEMLRFGGNLTLASTFNYWVRHADNVIVGAAFGASSLGHYSKAYQLLSLPIAQINAPIASVVVPALSRLSCNSEEYRRYYLRAITTIAMPGLVLSTMLLALARPFVAIVLGAGWEETAVLFWCLGPAVLTSVINVAGGWVFVTSGRTDRLARWMLCTGPLVVLAMLVGGLWGPRGVAIGFSIVFTSQFPFMLRYAYRGTSLRLRDIFRLLAPAAIVSMTSALAGFAAIEMIAVPAVIEMIVAPAVFEAMVGGAVYAGAYTLFLIAIKPFRLQWWECVVSLKHLRARDRRKGGQHAFE